MTSNTPIKSARSIQDLLEVTKLSRLPSLAARPLFVLEPSPVTKPLADTTCAGCGVRIEQGSEFQQSVRACRRCLTIYTKLDESLLDYAKRKAQDWLRKAGGAGELR